MPRHDNRTQVTRRIFLAASAGTTLLPGSIIADETATPTEGPFQATGTRVGEVTESAAIVWTRLTRHRDRNNQGIVIPQPTKRRQSPSVEVPAPPVEVPVEQIEGACPGAAGRVRLRYGLTPDLVDAVETPWVDVDESTDFIQQFRLDGLTPDRTYHYASESTTPGDTQPRDEFRGRFTTAPRATDPSSLRFCVMTCQGYPDRDHADGHPIYPSMLALAPRFVAMTGDLVYYDNDAPRATNPALARLHWERMFSLPRIVTMMRNTASYWLKDDHDTLSNDAYPGMEAGDLTFAAGQEIFRQQAPRGDSSYRTVRWGRDLQLWFTDGRDFRSPNDMPDGPEKTIWGAEQKAWFQRTVRESDATWKVLISPTPLVGPDRPRKNDNHANVGFAHEGNALRQWLQEHVPDNFFVICGDRHWQYHSVHPTTGVHEFSAGAASDSHAGGTPGQDENYHRFHRVKGGFLSVALLPEDEASQIVFQLHDVAGAVVYEAVFRKALT